VRLIQQYVGSDDTFLLTYGDGLGDVDINAVIDFHRKQGKVCTLTGVHPPGRFGELGIVEEGLVNEFNEKPQAAGGFINGGYMVCNKRLFDYLPDNPDMMLEDEPMKRLVADGELAVYCHEGFWHPMDTYAEFRYLNKVWSQGTAPWVMPS